jgi:endonuclease YncB( thermonuclease family)
VRGLAGCTLRDPAGVADVRASAALACEAPCEQGAPAAIGVAVSRPHGSRTVPILLSVLALVVAGCVSGQAGPDPVTTPAAIAEPERDLVPDREPLPDREADPDPKPVPDQSGWRVVDVVDGDTLDVRASDGTQERVRVIGIDTPERGECGYGEAAIALADLVIGRQVTLVPGARDDRDRYGRLLRYVDVESTDAGLVLVELGLAIARYDSRDGYGAHPREQAYVAADAAMPNLTCDLADGAGSSGGRSVFVYVNCDAVRAAGAAPIRRGDVGFGDHLDRDGDGVGCE